MDEKKIKANIYWKSYPNDKYKQVVSLFNGKFTVIDSIPDEFPDELNSLKQFVENKVKNLFGKEYLKNIKYTFNE